MHKGSAFLPLRSGPLPEVSGSPTGFSLRLNMNTLPFYSSTKICRPLFLEGGVQMALALMVSAACLGIGFSDGTAIVNADGTLGLPQGLGYGYLACMCLFTAGFAW